MLFRQIATRTKPHGCRRREDEVGDQNANVRHEQEPRLSYSPVIVAMPADYGHGHVVSAGDTKNPRATIPVLDTFSKSLSKYCENADKGMWVLGSGWGACLGRWTAVWAERGGVRLRVGPCGTFGGAVGPDASRLDRCLTSSPRRRMHCRFRPSIPSKTFDGRATTHRNMWIIFGFFLHILVQFKDEATLRAKCAEFLAQLVAVSCGRGSGQGKAWALR